MDRRTVLATSAAGLTAPLAGCSALTRDLSPSSVEESGRGETHLVYRSGGADVAVVSLGHRGVGRGDLAGLRTHLWHADGTHADSLRYEFRPVGFDHPPRFYLERPDGHPWEPIRFSRLADHAGAVVAVPDLGFQGSGSVTLDLLVDAPGEAPVDLVVDVEATVDPGRLRRDYRLDGRFETRVPREREDS